MIENADYIISKLEVDFPKIEPMKFKNHSDLNLKFETCRIYQFILGVTPHDSFGSGIDS
ncbi:MAG TPA: hypothetical protein VHB48_18490 [Chitinophagaceae bacterium]|nr:hypothetical protein [Chitinophagaceae bacterium]